jgi:protein tyrosine/serine phosphatase
MNRTLCRVVAIFFLFATAMCAVAQPASQRSPDWARQMIVPGITNFYQVTTNLYRGAQPTADGMRQLKRLGIKTVISLRALHSDKDVVDGTGLKSVRLEMTPLHVNEDEVVDFLKVVTDTNNLPAFVHCQRGADRTGTMCAMYRIVVCGWTKQQALQEMEQGGFHFSPVWQDLVNFVEKADVAEIKRRVSEP